MNNTTYGVELELINITEEQAAEALLAAGIKAQAVPSSAYSVPTGYWKICPDGSIRGGRTAEAVSPVLNAQSLATVVKVAKVLKAAGAEVDRSCGVHVHIGANTMGLNNLKARGRFVYNWHSIHNYILMVTSPSRINNRYCKPVTIGYADIERNGMERGIEESPQHQYNDDDSCGCGRYCGYRYTSINTASLKKHKTLEVRVFNGSTDGETVLAWTKLVEAIAKASVAGVMFEQLEEELNIKAFKQFRTFLQSPEYIAGMRNIISYLVDNGFLIPAVADRLYKRLNKMPELIRANGNSNEWVDELEAGEN